MKGEHSDIVKQVQLSPDGMVCLSAGSDCTFKVWDLSTRKCIKTYGDEALARKYSNYHRDTITTFDVSFDNDLAFTGGRDGTVFDNRIVHNKFNKIYQTTNKLMVTALKFDDIN